MITLFVEALHEAAKSRPPGYLEEALAAGKIEGSVIMYDDETYAQLRAKYQPQLPPLDKQGLSALSALVDEAGAIALGKKSVTHEERERRLSICRSCPEFTADSRCSLCGCFMEVKTRFRSISCPADPPKWTAIQ